MENSLIIPNNSNFLDNSENKEKICPKCVICSKDLNEGSPQIRKVLKLNNEQQRIVGRYESYYCCSELCESWQLSGFMKLENNCPQIKKKIIPSFPATKEYDPFEESGKVYKSSLTSKRKNRSFEKKEKKNLEPKRNRYESNAHPYSKENKKQRNKASNKIYNSPSNEKLILVVDTNVLLNEIDLLEKLRTRGNINIVIPQVVINEMNGLKNRENLKEKAKFAIDWIFNPKFKNKNHNFLFLQKKEERLSDNLINRFFPNITLNNDDEILISSIYFNFNKQSSQHKVALITQDRILKIKALSMNILSFSSINDILNQTF